MKSPTRRGSRLRRIVLTALSVSLVAGMALLSPAVAQASTNSMTGELRVGQTLTFHTDCPLEIKYMVWHLDEFWGPAEAGGPQYKVRASALGHRLVVTFQCGTAGEVFGPTLAVLPAKFDTVGTPGVTGEARVGQPLGATPGSWSPTPDSYSYQWFRGGSEIAEATSSTYVPKAEDLDQTLTVQVTASLAGYEDAAADSAPTAKVEAGLIEMITAPALSGTARVGETVTASAGEWSPKPSRVSYQWWRGGDQIEGATSPSYTLVDADHGRSVFAQVTVTSDGYLQAVWNAGSGKSVAGPVDARGVTVTSLTAGTPVVGTDNCVSIPVSMGYQVSSGSASTITTLTASAQVRNSKGATVGTVALASTDSALTGVATGTFLGCSSQVSGELAIAGLKGSYTGAFSLSLIKKVSKAEPPEDVRGTFESALRASATVPALTPVTPVKRRSGKIIWVQAFRDHAQLTAIGKVVVYNAKVKRWVAVSGRPKLILQKRINGTWTKVLTTRASKAAWFKATWKTSKKATYRVIRADRTTAVSKTFSR